MPDSEFARYDAFVDRTMSEVKKGLELDNHGAGSRKRRVHETLSDWDASDEATRRSPAQKVIDGRFILGGDDESYLANGLAMLWSTVGHSDEKHKELGLAPAALYSPDAVNGIRRGLLAAFEKKNEDLRNDAPNQLPSLMGALVPILRVLYGEGEAEERDAMRAFLSAGEVNNVGDGNMLFRFLVRAKRAIDEQDGPEGKDVPSSSLAFQVLRKAIEAHEAALQTARTRAAADLKEQRSRCEQKIRNGLVALRAAQGDLVACKESRAIVRSERDDCLAKVREMDGTITAMEGIVRKKEQELELLERKRGDETMQLSKESRNVASALAIAVERQEEMARAHKLQLDALKATVEDQKKTVARLLSEISKTEEGATNESNKHEAALEQAQAQVVTLKLELQVKTLECDEQAARTGELIRELREEQRQQETTNYAARAAFDAVTGSLTKVRDALGDCKQQLAYSQGEALRLKEQAVQLDGQVSEQRSKLQDLLSDNQRAEKELQTCNEERLRLQEKQAEDEASRDAERKKERLQLQETQVAEMALRDVVREVERELEDLEEGAIARAEKLAEEAQERQRERSLQEGGLNDGDGADGAGAVVEDQVGHGRGPQKRDDDDDEERLLAAHWRLTTKLEKEKQELEIATALLVKVPDGVGEEEWAAVVESQIRQLTLSIEETRQKLERLTANLERPIKERLRLETAVIRYRLRPETANSRRASPDDPLAAVRTWLANAERLAETLESEEESPDHAREATAAPAGDSWIDAAVCRGLVGQRGPTEPADVAHCPQDALLPYALPKIDEVVKRLLPARLLLESTADPTGEEVDRAMAALRSCSRGDGDGAKRQRVDGLESPAVISEALALFQDDFAITGTTPATELPPERCGVELPHEVRWMPQGPRASTMARVAVLEHAVARCGQLAARNGLRPSVAASLRHAATALKLQQLAPLYELHEAIEHDDGPHPLGTGAARLVTRPCAVVRGTLSFPSRPGVATLVERGGSAMPLTQDASLAQAMGKTAAATATLRNGLRREGRASNVYVAPETHELAFRSAPTRTGAGGNDPAGPEQAVAAGLERLDASAPAPAAVTDDRVPSSLYRDETFRRIVNRLIVAASALDTGGDGGNPAPDPVAAFLDVAKATIGGAGAVTPQSRREGLWAEMQRHVAVSQDRLWVFVRLMSGKVGGSASEVITLADEATLKAAKAMQEQRSEIAKRVSDMQSRIVETVVSSMLKNSKMTMEYKESSLAVIDAEARKNLKDLESGASGRPFFEANVALKNLSEAKEDPPALKDVLSGLANVAEQMHATLERTLAQPSAASASLVELSHPANSYFVTMRGDALAAIRAAQEMLNCELGVQGCRRRLATWELVEGGCAVLTARFAELCGYLLVQARTSTGVSAMYVSHQNLYTNASQARVALARLTTAARAYLARVAPPMFDSETPKEARFLALTQGEQVRDIDVTHRQSALPRAPLTAPIPANGWYQYGGFRRWS